MVKLRFLCILLVFALLLGSCLLQHRFIESFSAELIGRTQTVAQLVSRGALPEAEREFSALSARWQSRHMLLGSLIEHEYISEIDTELACLKNNLLAQNRDLLPQNAAELIESLRTVRQLEAIDCSNLF